MNEYQATKEYLEVLKQVYTEKGLVAAINHESIATLGSLVNRLAKVWSCGEVFIKSIAFAFCDDDDDVWNYENLSLIGLWNYNRQLRQDRLEGILDKNLNWVWIKDMQFLMS